MRKVLFLLLFALSCLQGMAQEDSTRVQYKQWMNSFDTLTQAPINEKFIPLNKKAYKLNSKIPDYHQSFSFSETSFNLKRLSINTIIPVAMITYGVLSRNNGSLHHLDTSTAFEVGEHLKVKIPIDDYSQYASLVSVFALDVCGVKARHNLRDRALITASSYAIMGIVVNTMKSTLSVTRPDGSNNDSFPSGHTAMAFTGARILFKEYRDVSPWIGIAGYGVATATGALRVLNKKHWVSDVVTGAGVGILSAEMGYRLLPVMHKALGIKNKSTNLAIIPACSTNQLGVGVFYTF